jgi:ATP-dependent RNA helicase DeaD
MEKFNVLDLPSEIIASLERMNITTPTEIQKQTIPLAIEGFDVLASSQTGSGKTMAYLLPIIHSLTRKKGKAIVLAPTRELATQIRDALNKILGKFRISSAVLIGGEPMVKQYSQLRGAPDVVIGTPGRVIDHLVRGTLKLAAVNMLVLDEMDRMLDMGMKEQIEEISKHIPEKRQVLMFSATMPKHIIALSQKYLNNPKHVTVGSSHKAAAEILQETLHLSSRDKFPELMKQLEEKEGSVIVFVKTKRGADELAKMLKAQNHKAEPMHGDLKQTRRERVILSFRRKDCRIIVATDVAARGLDIPHVENVINYDLPMCPEDYLHRIGRTGRAGAKGYALSFISKEDKIRWHAIDRLMNKGESTAREDMLGSKARNKKPFRNNKRDFFNANSGADGNRRRKRA